MTKNITQQFADLWFSNAYTKEKETRGSELLEQGANINCYDSKGRTLLMYAMEKQDFWMAYFLVNNGIDRYKKDARGKAAYDYITKQKRTSMSGSKSMKDFTPLVLANLADPDRWMMEWCTKRSIPFEIKDDTLYIKGDLEFQRVGQKKVSVPVACLPTMKTVIEGELYIPHVDNFPNVFCDFGGLVEVKKNCIIPTAKDQYALSRSKLEKVGQTLHFYGEGGFFQGILESPATENLPIRHVGEIYTFPSRKYHFASPISYICGEMLDYKENNPLDYLPRVDGPLLLSEGYPHDNLGALTHIQGDLRVTNNKIKSLGGLTTVSGNVFLMESNISDLGSLESCHLLDLNHKVVELKNVKKLGSLTVRNKKFHSLGNLREINHLDLAGTAVTGFKVPIKITELCLDACPHNIRSFENVLSIDSLRIDRDSLYQMYIPPELEIKYLIVDGSATPLDLFYKLRKECEGRQRESCCNTFDLLDWSV